MFLRAINSAKTWDFFPSSNIKYRDPFEAGIKWKVLSKVFCVEIKQSVIANTDMAVSLGFIFADVSIIQVFWPDTESRESSHSLYLSPVILQGNGRGLPIDLELLDSRGRVGGLHHHACLLVGQGGPLGCEGGLLRGDAPAGGLSVAPRPQTPSVGGRRGCWELYSGRERPERQ